MPLVVRRGSQEGVYVEPVARPRGGRVSRRAERHEAWCRRSIGWYIDVVIGRPVGTETRRRTPAQVAEAHGHMFSAKAVEEGVRWVRHRLANPILVPGVVLFGCRPFVPFHDRPLHEYEDDPFHVPETIAGRAGHGRSWPAEHCPCCRGRVTAPDGEDAGRICAWCHTVDLESEKAALLQRSAAEAQEALRPEPGGAAAGSSRLSESERRELWNGGRGDWWDAPLVEDDPRMTRRAREGRRFLTANGQEPDYGRPLSRKVRERARRSAAGRSTRPAA